MSRLTGGPPARPGPAARPAAVAPSRSVPGAAPALALAPPAHGRRRRCCRRCLCCLCRSKGLRLSAIRRHHACCADSCLLYVPAGAARTVWYRGSGAAIPKLAERVQLGLLPRAFQLHLAQSSLELMNLRLLLFQLCLRYRRYLGPSPRSGDAEGVQCQHSNASMWSRVTCACLLTVTEGLLGLGA